MTHSVRAPTARTRYPLTPRIAIMTLSPLFKSPEHPTQVAAPCDRVVPASAVRHGPCPLASGCGPSCCDSSAELSELPEHVLRVQLSRDRHVIVDLSVDEPQDTVGACSYGRVVGGNDEREAVLVA